MATIEDIRAGLIDHRVDNWQVLLMVTNVVEAQGKRIDDLSADMSNQQERHENQIAALRREIDKLKGVHGA